MGRFTSVWTNILIQLFIFLQDGNDVKFRKVKTRELVIANVGSESSMYFQSPRSIFSAAWSSACTSAWPSMSFSTDSKRYISWQNNRKNKPRRLMARSICQWTLQTLPWFASERGWSPCGTSLRIISLSRRSENGDCMPDCLIRSKIPSHIVRIRAKSWKMSNVAENEYRRIQQCEQVDEN